MYFKLNSCHIPIMIIVNPIAIKGFRVMAATGVKIYSLHQFVSDMCHRCQNSLILDAKNG
jgi:hypothetical protein